MTLIIPPLPVFSRFQQKPSLKAATGSQDNNKKSNFEKAIVLASSAAGVLAALALVGKGQGVNVFTKKGYGAIDYGPKVIGALATGSLIGGLGSGIALDKKNVRHKLREGVQQLLGNIMIPVAAIASTEKLCRKYGVQNRATKVVATIVSLVAGLFVGNKVSNYLNNLIFKEKQNRKFKVTDALIHVDDFCLGATLIARGTAISNVASKFLPPILIMPGYIAGTKGGKGHTHH